jgi:hypothetical protein
MRATQMHRSTTRSAYEQGERRAMRQVTYPCTARLNPFSRVAAIAPARMDGSNEP